MPEGEIPTQFTSSFTKRSAVTRKEVHEAESYAMIPFVTPNFPTRAQAMNARLHMDNVTIQAMCMD